MSRAASLAFLLCLALGVSVGLYLGWVASPVTYVDTELPALSQAYKDDYILMTATIFAQDANLRAAETRLTRLGLGENPGPAVAAAAGRLIAAHQPEADLRRIVKLAVTLGEITPEMQPYLP
jgi:hypothetical protein